MGKNKKDEKKRKKLRTLILLLFLTIIMFGTSTYAWFTANRVVTIQSLDVQVQASNGIQISTNAVDWKSVITNNDITNAAYTGNVNQVPTNVTAISTIPQATSQGRLNMYSAVVDADASTGAYTITTALETDTAGESGKYIAFDVFVRVDQEQAIYLTSDSDVTVTGNSEDKGLKNAARVGFVILGNTAATSSAETMTALNAGTSSTVIFWEPNVDAHRPIVISSVAPEYNVQLTEQTTGSYAPVAYRGIKYAITPALGLKGVVNGTTTVDGSSNEISQAVTPAIRTKANNSEYKSFATLSAGVTKIRVYMWIEGQDIDCENNATGSNISFNVQLSTQSSANGS